MQNRKMCGTCAKSEIKTAQQGLCRANPPTLIMLQGPAPGTMGVGNSMWPVVNLDTDYCWEWEQGPMVRVENTIPFVQKVLDRA